jgi:alpha-tubulin suppressor-like RCC1 family protein
MTIGFTRQLGAHASGVQLGIPGGVSVRSGSAGGGSSGGGSLSPPIVSIAALSASKPEGNSGVTEFTFVVTRSSGIGTTYIDWACGYGGDQANAADFEGGILPSGTIYFADGETSHIIVASAQGDADVEPDEGFTVTLSNPVNAVLGTVTAVGIILNEDAIQYYDLYDAGVGSYSLTGREDANTSYYDASLYSLALIGSPKSWKQVAAYMNIVVALDADGDIWHWGTGFGGGGIYYPNPNASAYPYETYTPVKVDNSGPWEQIAQTFGCTYLIKEGALYSVGSNTVVGYPYMLSYTGGQLGRANAETSFTWPPRLIDNSRQWASVKAGHATGYALDVDGYLFTWGYNVYGQCGLGHTDPVTIPTQVGAAKWLMVAPAGTYCLGIQIDGTLWGWGYCYNGTCYPGSSSNKLTPTKIADGPFNWVAAGYIPYLNSSTVYGNHVIAADGTRWCWHSYNSSSGQYLNYGMPGDGLATTTHTTLTQIGSDLWSRIYAYGASVVGVKQDETVWAWGFKRERMGFGQNTPERTETPVQILSGYTLHDMAMAGGQASYAYAGFYLTENANPG